MKSLPTIVEYKERIDRVLATVLPHAVGGIYEILQSSGKGQVVIHVRHEEMYVKTHFAQEKDVIQ